MSHEVSWNKIVLEEFIREALLTETEEKIMRTRIARWSRQKQSLEFNMSLSTIDRTISDLKKRYDEVQRYDPILPPRKRTKNDVHTETFEGFA